MSSTRLRFREKLSPQPVTGSVVFGVMDKVRKSDNVVVSTTKILGGGGSVPADIRRCWDRVNPKIFTARKRRPRRHSNVSYKIVLVPRLDADGSPMFKRNKKGFFIPIMRRKRVIDDVSTIFEPSESSLELSLDHDRGYREGGNFLSLHGIRPESFVKGAGTYRTVPEDSNASFYYRYTGGFGDPSFGSTDLLSDNVWKAMGRNPGDTTVFPLLDDYGVQGYSRLRPSLEKAGLAVALREAKDIPRMLQQTAFFFHTSWQAVGGKRFTFLRDAPKRVSDNFLNHYFGWVPFVNDLVAFDDVFQNSEKYIEQITRDNNSWIKRKRVLDYTESVTPITSGGATSGVQPFIGGFPYNMCRSQVVPGLGSVLGHWSIREELMTRVWAMGSFKYYRPEFDASLADYSSQWSDLQRRLKVYGAELSPTNVYKSTPWTWLIDWFSNVGDNIDAANDALVDGVASRYMYVMRHWVRRLVFNTTMFYWQGPVSLEWNRFIETKQRQRAQSSYGFSLLPKDLSAKQWSILAALGLSRSNLAARS